MSDTPRTDAAINEICPFIESHETMWLEAHARQLERENAELRKDAERWKSYVKASSDGAIIKVPEWATFNRMISEGCHQEIYLNVFVDRAIEAQRQGIAQESEAK